MSESCFIGTGESVLRGATEALTARITRACRMAALTGAGVSTESGIPDYRDERGEWKRNPPLRYQEFVASAGARRRYWARSMLGFPVVRDARPGRAHLALAALETAGRLHHIVTQNVDGLHQKAGSCRVIDLHGSLDRVACIDCGELTPRDDYQERLRTANRDFEFLPASPAPDGDADLELVVDGSFQVPGCLRCGGLLKPDVVFFGESVPKERVHEAMCRVDEADLLLVAGTSLMVWSGYRFVKRARERGVDVVAVNLGRTRADGEISLKIEADAGEALARVAASFLVESAPPSAVSSGRLGTGEPNALLLDRYS